MVSSGHPVHPALRIPQDPALYPVSLGKLMLLHKQISDLSDSVFGLLFPQRQTIELIPITEVHYWYQGKTSVYYIYGTDHQVYVADYPKRYCCGCTIL